jgi:hypothetical protein
VLELVDRAGNIQEVVAGPGDIHIGRPICDICPRVVSLIFDGT